MKNSSQKGKQNPHIAYPIFKIKNQYKGGGLKNKLNEQKVNELLHKIKKGKKKKKKKQLLPCDFHLAY